VEILRIGLDFFNNIPWEMDRTPAAEQSSRERSRTLCVLLGHNGEQIFTTSMLLANINGNQLPSSSNSTVLKPCTIRSQAVARITDRTASQQTR